jgi:hypothetical protein
MIQIVAVVILIPRLFPLNNSNYLQAYLPRTPNSAIAKVGMIASTKKITLTAQKHCHHPISTSNNEKVKNIVPQIQYTGLQKETIILKAKLHVCPSKN